MSFSLSAECGAQGAELKTYSVCQAINQAASINGKAVVIRGLFGGTEFHGGFLSQTLSDDPCPGWRSKYLTSPSAILLGSDATTGSRKAVANILSPCFIAYRSRAFRRYPVEIVGIFWRKSSFPLIFRRPDGSYVGWYSTGFGEGSGYPFMLVATAAKCAM